MKRVQQDMYILLKSGKKCLKMPFHIYARLCTAQLSVGYVKVMLEENYVPDQQSLCCYCRLSFISEINCTQHEDI